INNQRHALLEWAVSQLPLTAVFDSSRATPVEPTPAPEVVTDAASNVEMISIIPLSMSGMGVAAADPTETAVEQPLAEITPDFIEASRKNRAKLAIWLADSYVGKGMPGSAI